MLLDGPPPAGAGLRGGAVRRHRDAAPRVGVCGAVGDRRGRGASFSRARGHGRRAARHARAARARRRRRAGRLREFGTHGDTAEIEQVYVSAAQRGHGTGGALVAAAARTAAGPQTFIVADDEGDSKRLYAGSASRRVDPARLHAPARLAHREPAAAGVVGRRAQVAAEGGVGDRARRPTRTGPRARRDTARSAVQPVPSS